VSRLPDPRKAATKPRLAAVIALRVPVPSDPRGCPAAVHRQRICGIAPRPVRLTLGVRSGSLSRLASLPGEASRTTETGNLTGPYPPPRSRYPAGGPAVGNTV